MSVNGCKVKEALLRVVRRFLTPPPTSTNVERLFSYAGLILSNNRSSMQPEKLDQTLFIRENLFMLNFTIEWQFREKLQSFWHCLPPLTLMLSWALLGEGSVGRSLLFSLGLATHLYCIVITVCSLLYYLFCICPALCLLAFNMSRFIIFQVLCMSLYVFTKWSSCLCSIAEYVSFINSYRLTCVVCDPIYSYQCIVQPQQATAESIVTGVMKGL